MEFAETWRRKKKIETIVQQRQMTVKNLKKGAAKKIGGEDLKKIKKSSFARNMVDCRFA